MEKFNIVKLCHKLLFYPSSLRRENKGSAPGRWEVEEEEEEGLVGLAVRLQSALPVDAQGGVEGREKTSNIRVVLGWVSRKESACEISS